VGRFPEVNPISEGWFGRRTPIDHVGATIDTCPACRTQTSQDVFVAMVGRHGGVGVPFFLSWLTRRTSTAGKFGTRSRWGVCSDCHSVLPHDEAAQRFVEEHGHLEGFLNRP
jgi:hypothetical protein